MNIIKRTRDKFINTKQSQAGCGCADKEHGQSGSDHEFGQSLVEMAVMLVVLLIILGGVLDLGRMYFTYLALQNAAGEGAAYAAINPECKDDTITGCGDPNNTTYRVQNESTGNLIDWSNTTVIVEVPANVAGQPITVTVSYDYEVITPMIQVITGDELTLTAWDTQLIFVDPDN